MADPETRSEEPTEHRLAEARRRGVIAVSHDFQSGLTVLAVCVAMILGSRVWMGELAAYLRTSVAEACVRHDLWMAGKRAVQAGLAVLGIPLTVAVAVAILAGVVQTHGFVWSRPTGFDVARVLPTSMRRWWDEVGAEIGKSLGKTTIVVALVWWTIRPAFGGLIHLAAAPPGKSLAALDILAECLGLRLALSAVVVGVADIFWQRYRHRKSLRMTKEEVGREIKELEGDPLLKSTRACLWGEILRQQVMDEVRRASLVVTDGEGRTVALGYDPSDDRAPVVLCKGERLMAAKILQIAHDASIPVCTDVALTDALSKEEEGFEIPETSHVAVARLLAIHLK